MATFKAEIYAHQRRADGTYNVKIRVIHKQRKRYLSTPWYVGREDVTRSLKLKNQMYVDMVEDLIRRYRGICNRVGEALDGMSVDEVVALITKGDEWDRPFDLDIVGYGRRYVEELRKAGRRGNARAYETALNSLCRFAERDCVSVREITVKFLSDWMGWIMRQPAVRRKERGDRAPSLYFGQLRALFNRAKREFNDEEAGVIRIASSPFGRVDVPKHSVPRKRALGVEQVRMLAGLPYNGTKVCGVNRFNLAKDVFLLSFFLVGMNAADLYSVTDCCNGRITYQRTKTRNRRADKAEISIRLEPEVMWLMDKYRDPTGERVFNFYRLYSSMDTFNAALSAGIRLVGRAIGVEGLQFYAARHSWATIARNGAGIDKYTVHEALNHVDDVMRVTDVYIDRDWSRIDAANRAVIDFVFGKPEGQDEDSR